MKIYFIFVLIASCLGMNINEMFPDYSNEQYGVDNPYLFNVTDLEARGRHLVEYPYYTETEKDC